MSKVYLVDSENVGDDWIPLLQIAAPEDEILVFYTLKTPYMNYRNVVLLKESTKEIAFIECCEGSNALDFQLCTDLGFRIHEAPEKEFIIVTNDTGFDAAVTYWRKRKIQIKRVKGYTLREKLAEIKHAAKEAEAADVPVPEVPATEETDAAPLPEQSEEKPVCEEVPPVVPEKAAPCEYLTDADAAAREILFLVGKENLQELHEALTQLFGAERGKAYYDVLKPDTACSDFLAEHKALSTREKAVLYCKIVFAFSEGKAEVPEDFADFTLSAWRKKRNLNSLRASLQGKYGKEASQRYYSVMKPHIKILDKIK